MKYLFITLCVIFSSRMCAQENLLSDSKDWFADEENIHCGCSYVRSSQGTKMAVLYYSIKENEEKEGIKYSKMFVNVVELAELQGGIHEMVYIDDEYPNGQTCTDVLPIWQDGNKVYCQSEDGKQKWLILDFGLKTGDTFVNGIGEHYLVKETTNSDDSKRKKLLLISEDGTQEDIWEEGIGSLNWGFLPDYVVKTLKYFRDSDETLFANLWAAGIAPNYFMEQSVNDEYFKLQPFDEVKDDEAENMTFNDLNYPLSLNYSFIGDNLLIQGYYPLNYYPCFVAASISGANIDITLHQITTLNKIKGMHVAKIDVRIPGFSAGTYEIGLNGNKTQTVVCPGANGGTFLAQGTAWVDGFGYEQDGQYKLDNVKLFYYTTAGDTLINDKLYFRIRCTKRCMTSYKLDLDDEGNEYVREKSLYTDDGGLYFFMREDESGDVWFYTEDKNVFEEISHNTLYNDFNVADDLVSRDLFLFNAKKEYAVGDALPLGVIVFDSPNGYKEGEGFWDVYPYEVKGIDEMNLIDGKTYKRYNKYFLEGIGPLDGPLIGIGRPNSLNADVNQLFAFYKNGQLVYRNDGYLSALEELFPNILDILTGDNNIVEMESVSYTKDQMATIILPTAPDASKGKYYALNRCEEGKIIFTEEREPKARVPYIIVPKEDFTIDLNKLDLESLLSDTVSVKGAMFIGSYNSAEMNCQEGFYIDILDATPDCQIIDADQRKAAIGALRAYLVAPWDDPYAQGGSRGVTVKREIVLQDNGTSLTPNPNIVREGSIYDLSGRKVNSQFSIFNSQFRKKGVYIQNGVKRVVR